MDFITKQRELSDRVRAYDETISADATKLQRWINLSVKEISGEWNWPWLRDFIPVQTVIDITTGTLTATTGSTSITFSSAPSVSVAGRFIQTSDSNDWYEISAHTAASTSATLAQNYLGTGGSGLTYTVRAFFYSVDSSVDRIISAAQSLTPQVLTPLDHIAYDESMVFSSTTGTPRAYYTYGLDSSQYWQVGFYPTPDATINVWLKVLKKETDMSADSNTPLIPAKYHDVILDLASFYAFSSLDDSRATTFYQKYQVGLERMKRTCNPQTKTRNVMRACDEGPSDEFGVRLPDEFGR